jgi:hypothetical protein
MFMVQLSITSEFKVAMAKSSKSNWPLSFISRSDGVAEDWGVAEAVPSTGVPVTVDVAVMVTAVFVAMAVSVICGGVGDGLGKGLGVVAGGATLVSVAAKGAMVTVGTDSIVAVCNMPGISPVDEGIGVTDASGMPVGPDAISSGAVVIRASG